MVPKPTANLAAGVPPTYWAVLRPAVAPPADDRAATILLIPLSLILALILGLLILTVALVPTLVLALTVALTPSPLSAKFIEISKISLICRSNGDKLKKLKIKRKIKIK